MGVGVASFWLSWSQEVSLYQSSMFVEGRASASIVVKDGRAIFSGILSVLLKLIYLRMMGACSSRWYYMIANNKAADELHIAASSRESELGLAVWCYPLYSCVEPDLPRQDVDVRIHISRTMCI